MSGEVVLPPLQGHTCAIMSAAFSPNGTRIISSLDDNTIQMWDAMSGTEVISPLQEHEDQVNTVAFAPDGAQIVSGSKDEIIQIWDAEPGAELSVMQALNWVQSVAFSSNKT
jgi:WD40 repeat protein